MGCLPSSLLQKTFITGQTNINYAARNQRWAQRVSEAETNGGSFRSGTSESVTTEAATTTRTECSTVDAPLLKEYFDHSARLERADAAGILLREITFLKQADQWLLLSTLFEEITSVAVQLRFAFETNHQVILFTDDLSELEFIRNKCVLSYNNDTSKIYILVQFWERNVIECYQKLKSIHEKLTNEEFDARSVNQKIERRSKMKEKFLKCGDILRCALKMYSRTSLLQQANQLAQEPPVDPEVFHSLINGWISTVRRDSRDCTECTEEKHQLVACLEKLLENNDARELSETIREAVEVSKKMSDKLLNTYLQSANTLNVTSDELTNELRHIRTKWDLDVFNVHNISRTEPDYSPMNIPSVTPPIIRFSLTEDVISLLHPTCEQFITDAKNTSNSNGTDDDEIQSGDGR